MAKNKLTENQKQASNPLINVWVQANAGTGKTKVLVQRLLRILFRGEKHGSILCLTYTTAGADEMRNRILSELSTWNYASDEELRDYLVDIVEDSKNITDNDLIKARKLFYDYIDAREPVKIQTIHSFCQDILSRFSVEAGVEAGFKILDESNQSRILSNCFHLLFNKKQDEELNWAWNRILSVSTEYSFDDIQNNILKLYPKFFDFNDKTNMVEYFSNNAKKFLEIEADSIESLTKNFINKSDFGKIKSIAEKVLSNSDFSSKIINAGAAMMDFSNNKSDLDKYISGFIKSDNQKYQLKLDSKKMAGFGEITDFLRNEQDRIFDFCQNFLNLNIYLNTKALIILIKNFISIYKEEKHKSLLLDYDDLILYTKRLFSNPETMGWVLSQLDSGLQYILVDEAQDTNPEQWDIIKSLIGDFYNYCSNFNKSIFVVGDLKQSIFSFQGADPDVFRSSEESIAEIIKNNHFNINKINLDESFRTTAPILNVVDGVFNSGELDYYKNQITVHHKVARKGDAGIVELIPCLKKEKKSEDLDIFEDDDSDIRKKYSEMIADKIEDLIKNQKIESTGGQIKPSDIMILLKNRNPLTVPIINALKNKGLPVNGSDKIKLSDHIVIQDLMAIMNMAFNAYDDYNLACVLKSPLFDLSENDLLDLCYKRGNYLIEVIKNKRPEIYKKINDISAKLSDLSVYSAIMYLLDVEELREKFLSRIGISSYDPMNEFLNCAISFDSVEHGSIQEFSDWFLNGQNEIKRDMDKSDGIRILTVHGSKGLEAPIVFLVDTINLKKNEKISAFVDSKTLLWIPPKSEMPDNVADSLDEIYKNTLEESYRLLYVAMTRARDQLYISGMTSYQSVKEDSWYDKLAAIIPTLDGVERKVDSSIAGYFSEDDLPYILKTEQKNPVLCSGKNTRGQTSTKILTITHNSLNNSDIIKLDSKKSAKNYVKNLMTEKNSKDTGNLVHSQFEKGKIDNNSRFVSILEKFSWIFDSKGLNERTFIDISDTGYQVIRIDRLVFNDNLVSIIDYKTDENPELFRESYIKKLNLYKTIIEKVYPDKKVKAYLFWLSKEELEEVK